jgi:hypothetical protein
MMKEEDCEKVLEILLQKGKEETTIEAEVS